jgi:lipopolysaccharide heptosyltransferase II
LLFAPRFRRRVTLDELATARILILKPCCLGDVIFATPLIRELRRALPLATVDVAVGHHSRPALAGNPHVTALIDLGSVGSGRTTWRDVLFLTRLIRSRRYDACFILERSAVLNLVPLLAGVPRRIGIDSGGRGFSLGVGISIQPARPESELYLDLFRAIGGKPASGLLEYYPEVAATGRVKEMARDHFPADRPLVVLHCAGGVNPGMTLPRKRWPPASFRALAQRIIDAGGSVALVGAAEDRPVAELVLQGFGEAERESGAIVDLTGQLSLDEVAALARLAAVYVGNDSGPTHVAEAVGSRVVMLFGPSSVLVYGPRGRNATALSARIWCSPCFEDGRFPPCANVICMESIDVERVWRAVQPAMTESAVAP